MENEKLKPCPLCGAEADIVSVNYDRRYFCVCEKCNYKGEECWDVKEAIEEWNRRTKENETKRNS